MIAAALFQTKTMLAERNSIMIQSLSKWYIRALYFVLHSPTHAVAFKLKLWLILMFAKLMSTQVLRDMYCKECSDEVCEYTLQRILVSQHNLSLCEPQLCDEYTS